MATELPNYGLPTVLIDKTVLVQTLLSPRHTLNVFSDPRSDKKLELVEATKGYFDAIIVLNQKGGQLVLNSTSFNLLSGRTFNACLGGNRCVTFCRLSSTLVSCHYEVETMPFS